MATGSEENNTSGGGWIWSKLTGSAQTPAVPTALPVPVASEVMPIHLKTIKTPHTSISHPELAFSPTDIGIWEVQKGTPRKPAEGDRKPSEGFKSWGTLFGGS